MKPIVAVAVAGLLASVMSSTSCTSETSALDVPDARPAHHVVDLTGTLAAPEIEAIDAAASAAAVDGELYVVVVDSTGAVPPRQWTTLLFNRLRLDRKDRNRGVLLMAALTDRKSEIVVGDGFPGDVTKLTDDIMQTIVVAHFKAQDPRRALVEGARAIAARVIARPAEPTVPPPPSPALAAAAAAAATAPQVLAIVDPRPGSVIVDRAGFLAPNDVYGIESIARVQIAADIEPLFVVVKSTDGLPSRAFAMGLFERLQLGASGLKRGLLVLAVDDDRIVEIVSGAGFPPSVAPSIARLATEVAARMKEGGAPPAMALAARSISNLGMELDMGGAMIAQAQRAQADAARSAPVLPYTPPPSAMDAFDVDTDNPLVFVGGAGVLGVAGLGVREALRRRPRSCGKCQVRMHRLAEEIDDKHLQAGEQAEERLGSVDYDVWACGTCGSVLKTRWGAIFSSYARCSGCSWKTMTSSSRTITSATTSSTGLAEITENCTHCSHHRSYTKVIPRVQKSSSSSGSSSGGGGYSSGRGSSGSW